MKGERGSYAGTKVASVSFPVGGGQNWPMYHLKSPPPPPPSQYSLQLFRERLSEKVQAAIPKSIVGGFECPVSQRNLKEWNERA